jgi:hypothetical protein
MPTGLVCADTRHSVTGWCMFLGDADNTSAIQIAANPLFHERPKHIEVDCHSIREAFACQKIILPHISTEHQIADPHQFLIDKLMLLDRPASI